MSDLFYKKGFVKDTITILGMGSTIANMLSRKKSSISDGLSTIELQVLIEESHRNRLTVTNHPVEEGAPISDYAYMQPAELTIKAGFSRSNLASYGRALSELVTGDSDEMTRIYETFLKMQREGRLMVINTSRRTYENMLIVELGHRVNKDNYNILELEIVCREVIVTSTQILGKVSKQELTTTKDPAIMGEKEPEPVKSISDRIQSFFR